MTVREQKKDMRRALQKEAADLDAAYCADVDRRILGRLLASEEYLAARTVFCFVGTSGEIDTKPFLEQVLREGRRLAVPLCTGPRQMEAREIRSLCELRKGRYGLLEPDASAPAVPPEEIGLAVIPCVSCGHDGTRLGHGGGYYDVFFEERRQIPCIMICREKLVRETIPREMHDLVFPWVITETGFYRDGKAAECAAPFDASF